MRRLIKLLWLILPLLVLSGCVTQKACLKKFPPETRIVESKEIIKEYKVLPGATVTDTLWYEKIVELPVNKWIIKKDTSGLAELRIYKDAHGRLIANCEANERAIEQIKEVIKSTKSEVIIKEIKHTPKWKNTLIWVLLAFVTFFVIKDFGSLLLSKIKSLIP